MPKTLHQKFYIKHHEKYFDVDVDVTSYMMYVMYDVPNTGCDAIMRHKYKGRII